MSIKKNKLGFLEFDNAKSAHDENIKIHWLMILPLIVLIVDIIYAITFDNGLHRLENTFNKELAILQQVTSQQAIDFIYNITRDAYQLVFIKSGLLSAFNTSSDEMVYTITSAFTPALEAASIGFRLFMLRIAICILLLPFFLLIFTIAFIDGLYARKIRTIMAKRESGFLYHRSKRFIFLSVIAFWLVYITPPVFMDPRYVLPPFVFLMALSLRTSVKYFKKYL